MAESTTIARPYARAAFAAAKAADPAQWSEALGCFAAIVEHEQTLALLKSPVLTSEAQVNLLCDLYAAVQGAAPDDGLRNLLGVLAENKRLPLLPEVVRQFEFLRAQEQQSIDVTVVTARPLQTDRLTRLADVLRRKFERSIQLDNQVDPELIGGAVVRAGDLVIDGSVRGKLAKLAEAMNS